MGKSIKLLAMDLGASSGRVMLGSYDGEHIAVEEIHRFPNQPVQLQGHLYWDVLRLFHEMKQGIRKAVKLQGSITSLSVDTWGVDYGFIDRGGQLLYSPHHYRDQRTEASAAALEALLPKEEQFRLTGNQSARINSVYQLYADLQASPWIRETADKMLMMPDLFHYLFSGAAYAEQTIWSTGGLLTADSAQPSVEVLNRLGLPAELIPALVPAGTVIGTLLPALQEELGTGPLKVIAGASHDTASAVASIPYRSGQDAAFISCGTWSLVGMESEQPVITDQARAFGFTNEACFGGTSRLLKNTTGLWILQESQRGWAEAGEPVSHQEAVELARSSIRSGYAVPIIDPNDDLFSTPGDMPGRIAAYCARTRQPVPQSKAEIILTILSSLAASYAKTLRELEQLTGRNIRIIHMVGGGIQNELLCQLTADAAGTEVAAGPVEASAIGNIAVQLAALGEVEVPGIRELVAHSYAFTRYYPAS
ncbi:rhamnulokinase [Paenibacillus sp. PK3_47]|uniref:rhamnulokinase n=1 Tax=Paenibacillus sp. PK3_47 TaxID=2072642 RepID=UPI00201D3DDD|nr:rhamnulokinase family protein [Paenibacillus sp. PK3_47]UQZ33063.1 rhamnulokinase [Paenibacillus sp. PK3_47]